MFAKILFDSRWSYQRLEELTIATVKFRNCENQNLLGKQLLQWGFCAFLSSCCSLALEQNEAALSLNVVFLGIQHEVNRFSNLLQIFNLAYLRQIGGNKRQKILECPKLWMDWHYLTSGTIIRLPAWEIWITGSSMRRRTGDYEANSAYLVAPKTLLYSPLHSFTSSYNMNVEIATCFKTWVQLCPHFGLQTLLGLCS